MSPNTDDEGTEAFSGLENGQRSEKGRIDTVEVSMRFLFILNFGIVPWHYHVLLW